MIHFPPIVFVVELLIWVFINLKIYLFLDVCPEGEKAYVNAMDSTVRECLINVEGSCPSNYLCRFNAPKNRYYCCASISGGKNFLNILKFFNKLLV